jgi:lipopolysaccharide heptosyltransferase II
LTAEHRGERVLPDAPNVLVIETGSLGELLVVTPALRAFRKAFPCARVTVLVSPGSSPLLVGNRAVNRLLPLTKEQRAGLAGVLRVAAWIRAQRFDVALVLHTSFRSALLAALAGVPIRAGLASEGRGFLLTHKAERDRAAYEVDEHLKVLGLLGVPPDGRAMELPLLPEEREEAARLLHGPTPGSRVVGLHPGASAEFRRWPVERFAELGAGLTESGIEPVYVFGPKETPLAEAVDSWWRARGLPAPRSVAPRTVRILGALFERADAVVTNNTGPMHVAAAVGAAGVFIHGPTPVARWHPPGDRWVAVFAENVACRPCDSPACRVDRVRCMEAVTVERVRDALAGVIERLPERRTA